MNLIKRAFFQLLLLLYLPTQIISDSHQNSQDVLFVGNSYTYYSNLPQIVSLISDSTNTPLITRKSTVGGANLKAHWEGQEGLRTREIIKQGNFDVVVLQDHSMEPITVPDTFLKYAKLLCDIIKEQGGKPAFYVTWAREMDPQYQKTINQVYATAAAKNDAMLVPVGNAWQLARALRPTIQLYSNDGSHPSELGTFLTACVFVANLSGELPDDLQEIYNTVDIFGESLRLMKLDPLDVIFCKKIAEAAVLK